MTGPLSRKKKKFFLPLSWRSFSAQSEPSVFSKSNASLKHENLILDEDLIDVGADTILNALNIDNEGIDNSKNDNDDSNSKNNDDNKSDYKNSNDDNNNNSNNNNSNNNSIKNSTPTTITVNNHHSKLSTKMSRIELGMVQFVTF